MQKVKITSTSFIKRPKALENIDVSYGVSYFCIKSMEVKTLSNKNSWAIKILSKIEKLSNLFKSKIEEDNQIINQIMEDSNFISTHQQECAKDLHIQINSETKLKNTLTSLADLDYSNRNLVQDGLDSKAGKIYSTTKKMFLGLNFFKKGESFFDSLIKNFSLKETDTEKLSKLITETMIWLINHQDESTEIYRNKTIKCLTFFIIILFIIINLVIK